MAIFISHSFKHLLYLRLSIDTLKEFILLYHIYQILVKSYNIKCVTVMESRLRN